VAVIFLSQQRKIKTPSTKRLILLQQPSKNTRRGYSRNNFGPSSRILLQLKSMQFEKLFNLSFILLRIV
jgi:hypothetical protein